MKTKVSLKMFVLSVVLLMTSFVASARSYDGQLVYNPVEENGVMVGQTVYKMNGSTLANYMKYNYKYDDNKRMIESETLKWNSTESQLILRITVRSNNPSSATASGICNIPPPLYLPIPIVAL